MAGQARFLRAGRRLPESVWRQRHRWLNGLLWAHVPALFCFALLRGYPVGHAGIEVVPLALGALVAMSPRLGRGLRSGSTSVALVASASVLVHLSDGAIEAHFHFFVLLGFLTLYQAWLPYLLALLYVVVEHGVLGTIYPQAVYNHPADIAQPWKYAAIHGGFVLAASLANVLAWRLTEQVAMHDALTGLPNRAFLLESLSDSLAGAGRDATTVVVLDLDNFKDANAAFGHLIGDEPLVTLATRLRDRLRTGDVLARLGGDEFALVLHDVPDHAAAVVLARRVLDDARVPLRIGDFSLDYDASVGVALPDTGTTSAVDLLRNAGLAMHGAKQDGGGKVAEYTHSLHADALRRTELEAELRVALERDQFVLRYQPIVELAGRRLVGVEALIRWRHPVRGLVGPADFIAAAEQSGLIVALGAWVIRAACDQGATWQRLRPDRLPLIVAVNLSPRQLADRTLVGTVAAALHESGLSPSSLCLEITEGSVIKDLESTMPTLRALRGLGVSLALDDFGTGYSSLSYLKQLPVTSVKIDRSFVADLEEDGVNASIVRAVIELAHALGMSVTAEGVETPAQLEGLAAMGSDQVQGYLLGRPMSHGALNEILDSWVPFGARLPLPRSQDHGRAALG